MTASPPRIAVLLPVYNGAPYVAEAIQSVLEQTFEDFELLVIDNGSTDGSPDILSRFTDARLRVIRFPKNRGVVDALNTGIGESQSELIARMDADDICMPQRFERQVQFLEAEPEVSICGTWMHEFGACDALSRPPITSERIRAGMFFGWVMNHPTMMLRRSLLEKFGISYRDDFEHVEDFELLIRASEFTRLANIPEYLLKYRRHPRQLSVTQRELQGNGIDALLVRQLRCLLPDVTSVEERFHLDLAKAALPLSLLGQAEDWLLRLDRANRQKGRYNVDYFRQGLSRWWFWAHSMQAVSGSKGVLWSYWGSPLASLRAIGLRNHVAMAAKWALRHPAPQWWKSYRHFIARLQAEGLRRKP